MQVMMPSSEKINIELVKPFDNNPKDHKENIVTGKQIGRAHV